MRHLSVILVSLCVVISVPAWARPVSWPGIWTLVMDHDDNENSALIHYTVTPKLALGYRVIYDRASHDTFHGIQMNNLLKRWNNPDSQANIYFKSAVGFSQKAGDPEGLLGLQADWENRRLMMSYDNRMMYSSDAMRRKFMQEVEFGLAPYVAEFGSLHTWAMVHVIHEPEDRKNIQVAPMLRLFKGDILIEGGYNVTKRSPIANAVIRF